MKIMLKLKHIPIILICLIIISVVILILNSCSSMSGYYDVENCNQMERVNIDEIKQFPDGANVPNGYEYITTVEYKTGWITVQCDYHHMVKTAREAVQKSGGDAFRLNNIKTPDITNTCYRCNVLVFKKKL
jgi:hypothetical protein